MATKTITPHQQAVLRRLMDCRLLAPLTMGGLGLGVYRWSDTQQAVSVSTIVALKLAGLVRMVDRTGRMSISGRWMLFKNRREVLLTAKGKRAIQ